MDIIFQSGSEQTQKKKTHRVYFIVLLQVHHLLCSYSYNAFMFKADVQICSSIVLQASLEILYQKILNFFTKLR